VADPLSLMTRIREEEDCKLTGYVNEEVSQDMTGEADGMNQGVDSRDGVMHI